MDDLKKRFGRLVMAHRKRLGLTQEQLAEKAGASVDMISKIETGATGARFAMIERIAVALEVDPAELFTTEIPNGAIRRAAFSELCNKLAGKSADELRRVSLVLDAMWENQ